MASSIPGTLALGRIWGFSPGPQGLSSGSPSSTLRMRPETCQGAILFVHLSSSKEAHKIPKINDVHGFHLGGLICAALLFSRHDRAAFDLYTPWSGDPGGQVTGSVIQALRSNEEPPPLHAGVKARGLPGRGGKVCTKQTGRQALTGPGY